MHKVLLITNENEQCQAQLSKILTKLGYKTLCTSDTEKAQQVVAERNIYAVFIDLDTIDEMTRLENLVNNTKQYSKIVLLGPESKSDMICRAFEMGADDYLRKPFKDDIFEARTKCIFARYESIQHTHIKKIEDAIFVTYLQQINDTLKTEKNKLSLLFENMSSGFMLVEHKDDMLYLKEGNAKLSEILKIDITKYYNKRLRDISMFYPQQFYVTMFTVLETGQSKQFIIKAPVNESVFNVNMYQPEPDYVAVLINDITEETLSHRENLERAKQLRKLNLLLDDRNNELKTAIETKNKFISIIAHDLRNPLNAINGLSELLTRKLDPEKEARALEMAKILHQSAKSAYELLDNLLIWARTQQNTIQFVPENIDIHSVTTETINEIKVQAEKKHIMLINSTTNGDTAWADKLMYQTIVRNITSNAIKFTNEGGLIVITSSQTPECTEITIEDNGTGMTTETMNSLMDISKVTSTKGTSGETGTGMGLIITKEFIQRHKGTLHIDSTLGKGSRFTVTFPANKDDKNEN